MKYNALVYAIVTSHVIGDVLYSRENNRDGFEHANPGGRELNLEMNVGTQTPMWWTRIRDEYQGSDLRQCARKKQVPEDGMRCGKFNKTCYFGTQNCPSIGPHPLIKCTCNRTAESRRGIWYCSSEMCPGEDIGITKNFSHSLNPMNTNTTSSVKESPGFETKSNSSDSITSGDSNNAEYFIDLNETLTQASEKLITFLSSQQTRNPPTNGGNPWMRWNENFPEELRPKPHPALDYGSDNEAPEINEANSVKTDERFVYAAYGSLLIIWDIETGDLVANFTAPDWQLPLPQTVAPPTVSIFQPVTEIQNGMQSSRPENPSDNAKTPIVQAPTQTANPNNPPLSLTSNHDSFSQAIQNTFSPSVSPSVVNPSQVLTPKPTFFLPSMELGRIDTASPSSFSSSSALPTLTPICNTFFDTASPSTIHSNSKCPKEASRPYWFYDHFRPRICGIFVQNNRVILIVEKLITKAFDFSFSQRDTYYTYIVILDTSSQSIQVISQELISHGRYKIALSTGNDIHILTSIPIDYTAVETRIQDLWTSNMNILDFDAAIMKVAPSLMKSFVNSVMNQITRNGTVPRYSSWWPSQRNNETLSEAFATREVNSFAMLTSFSVPDSGGKLALKDAGFFSPSPLEYIYPLKGEAATKKFSITLQGNIAERSSVAIFGDYIRVATESKVIDNIPDPNFDGTIFKLHANITILLSILKIPILNETTSQTLSQISLSSENEYFSYLRCFKNICYVGVNQYTDGEFIPIKAIYSWDVNPENSRILGRNEKIEFSPLLYSINKDKNLLLAIREPINFPNGTQIGAQISLFDVNNASNPVSIHRIVIKEINMEATQSLATWDYQNFRWLSFGDGVGILFLPLNVVSFLARAGTKGNFDGYIAYDVSRDGIFPRFNISHVASEKFYDCYHQAFLPERTLFLNGCLITLKEHSVVSKALDTGIPKWSLVMPKPLMSKTCMFWLF